MEEEEDNNNEEEAEEEKKEEDDNDNNNDEEFGSPHYPSPGTLQYHTVNTLGPLCLWQCLKYSFGPKFSSPLLISITHHPSTLHFQYQPKV